MKLQSSGDEGRDESGQRRQTWGYKMGEIEGAEVHQEIVFNHVLPSGGIGTSVKGMGDNMVPPNI